MKIAIALVACLLMCGAANATLIPFFLGPPVANGSNFTFNYRIDLTSDERADPAATGGVTCPGPSNTKVQCNPAGTFVTLYDIPGFQSASVSAPGWGASIQLTGLTPSSIMGSSIDNSTLLNVTFMYTGPVVSGATSFTGFSIVSSLNGLNTAGTFSSQATKNTGTSAGDTDQTAGPVTVPAATTGPSVPEPASMVLIGSGLLAVAFLRRRTARR